MKKKLFSGPVLLCGLLAFVLFMVAACAAYYFTAKVFVTAELAVLYAVLGLLGGLALVFRRRLFAAFFYIGCILGWLTGNFVASLEGAFAPTAGVICTFFLIAVFALIGGALEWSLWKRRRAKEIRRREKQRQEDESREKALLEAQKSKLESQEESVPERTLQSEEETVCEK
ncbi:MAG: hypothetical protein EOM52_04840 [Clostridia bacterium]|nr:hypothetical protein [Clostridia bacterium]